jgi:phage recombination protein Bet
MSGNKPTIRTETASLTAGMSREQIDLIKATVARGATDDELKLFLYTANRTQLDPLTKQIHFIKRKVWNPKTKEHDEVGTIQTGIDGYRVVASRNGLAGIEDAIFDAETEVHPNKASVTVYRMVEGVRVPFTASARWAEYVQLKDEYKNNAKTGNKVPAAMWEKMPYLMLAKVAEALALRKAFPNDLSGVYTNEEMAQAETEVQIEPERVSYKVERAMPASDDEAGGSTVRQEAVQDELNDARKEQIKGLLKSLGKPARKEIIKELTGLDMIPENYVEITKKLYEAVEKTDAFSQVMNGEDIK